MHFHLPKPLHGWRAFVGEVGVVVLGVLLALGAQQFADAIHSRFRASQAQTLLREEIADHYFTAAEAVISAPCIDRQLQSIESSLTGPAGSFSPVPSYSGAFGEYTIRIPNRVWSDDVWRSVVSSGVVSSFPDPLRFRLGEHYTQVAFMRDDTRATDLTAWHLRALARKVQPDAVTRTRLIGEIEEARGRFSEMAFVGNEVIGQVEDLKLTPPNSSRDLAESGTIIFCRSHGLPLGRIDAKHQF